MRSSASSRRRTRTDTVVTIPVQATAAGSITANAFAGWTNLSGGAITSVTAFGTTAKYLHADTFTTLFARSVGVSFDQEVTFWTARGRVYLRLTDAGEALCLVVETDGSWFVLYVPVVETTSYFDTGTSTLLGSGTPSGIDMADTAGDEWTFGVSGFEVYVKWNGVEQWRGKQIYHHTAGRVGLRTFATGTTHGFRSVSATFKPSGTLFSSPLENIIDVRDFGLKTLTATGSMSAASTTLTLTSNPGFEIGDSIIVVIGGEAGLGEPGTRGVGGQWPALTYADNTAMTADTGQAVGKIAARLDNGLTYRWSGSAWVAYNVANFGGPNAWHDRMLPRSLITTITNVSGTTLTLADASVLATTGATVVFNNATRLEAEIGYNYTGAGIPTYVDGKTISFPAGTWYVGQYNSDISMVGGESNWTIRGAGRDSTIIRDVMGVTGLRIQPENKTNLSIEDIEFKSNRKGDKGWLWYYETNDTPQNRVPGVFKVQGSSVTASGIRATNVDFTFDDCGASTMTDIAARWEVGQRAYAAWQVQLSNCTGASGTNIVIDNDQVVAALEIFGGTGCSFSDVTITNGLIATNAADDWTISNITATIETNGANNADYDWSIDNAALVNINSNIDPVSPRGGGTFTDFNLTINYANAANYLFQGFNINGDNQANFTISGDFPAKPNTNGLITYPVGWSDAEGIGIYVGGGVDNVDITGIRVTPPNSGAGGEVFLYSSNSSITNSVVDVVNTDQTTSGNITNAAYDAL
jgi:hypothetical protein